MSAPVVTRLDPARVSDFFQLHCAENDCDVCYCAAWWVPSWEAFKANTPADNRALREALFARGEHDGYLLYRDGAPVAWCQVGPRDRLEKLVAQYALEPDPDTWAVTCFVVAPSHRRRGLARQLLAAVLEDLPGRGARRVEAFPKRGDLEVHDLWTGPEALFLSAGFEVVRDDPSRPVLAQRL